MSKSSIAILTIPMLWLSCLIFLTNCAIKEKKTDYLQAKQIALAKPIIKANSTFFHDSLQITLGLNLAGVEIRYTFDGSEPYEQSLLFTQPIILKKSATIKARAFHVNYLPSEVVHQSFLQTKDAFSIKTISLNPLPNESYPGSGATSLIDQLKGAKNFKDGAWLGFADESLEIVLEGEEVAPINQVIISLLSDQNSWIFSPHKIKIYTSTNGEDYIFIAEKQISPTEENSVSNFRFERINVPPQEAKFVKVILENIPKIPDWHPGKGTAPWLFIDEVLIMLNK